MARGTQRRHRRGSHDVRSIVLVILATFVAAFGQFFQKKGADTIGSGLFTIISNPYIILGVALYMVCGVLYIIALRHGELSILFPLMSLNLVWVAFLSSIVFHEGLLWNSWLGTGLIILGAVFLGRGA